MWQAIETAPLDGTAIWLWYEGGCYIGYFHWAWAEPLDKWFICAGVRRQFKHKNALMKHDEIFSTYA